MAMMIMTYRFMPMLFGTTPVATLPFQPPAFVQKVTLRGMGEGADPRACSPLFIFMLCQGSIKVILAKLLGWGPSRRMTEVKPTIPKMVKQA